MTILTKEYIQSVRMCSYLIEPPASEVVGNLCDHIEHLQKRVEELEITVENYKSIMEGVRYKIDKKNEYIAELESVNEDQALTIAQNDYAYTIDKEMMEAEIKASNDLLRSAWMIAKRDGKDTNWEAFRGQLNNALARQHKMIYPKGEK